MDPRAIRSAGSESIVSNGTKLRTCVVRLCLLHVYAVETSALRLSIAHVGLDSRSRHKSDHNNRIEFSRTALERICGRDFAWIVRAHSIECRAPHAEASRAPAIHECPKNGRRSSVAASRGRLARIPRYSSRTGTRSAR